jgi:zinc/manganese transport system substrate-binding protein
VGAAAVVIAGCAAPAPDDDRISVVASTDVWGSVVEAVGGDLVRVTSLIDGAAQDPHEFEASARDQLEVSDADLIVENGGGYDDFIDTLVDASGTEAVVVSAVNWGRQRDEIASNPMTYNEHVWYQLPVAEAVAWSVADRLAELDPEHAEDYRDGAASFVESIDALIARERSIATEHEGAGYLVTEPVPVALLGDSGLTDRTPPEFSEAVEEGADVSVALLDEVLGLIAGGGVALLAVNAQTGGPETQRVVDAAAAADVPVVEFTETLPEGEDYLSWMAANLDALEAALR